MKISYYYKLAAVYPSMFVLLFAIIDATINSVSVEGYLSFGFIIESVIPRGIYLLFMSLLSTTIFLNKIKRLNTNLYWNIITWFLIPVGYLGFAWLNDLSVRLRFDFGFGTDFIYLMVVTFPFVIGLVYSFIRYRESIASEDLSGSINKTAEAGHGK